jgi:hypothetical protein
MLKHVSFNQYIQRFMQHMLMRLSLLQNRPDRFWCPLSLIVVGEYQGSLLGVMQPRRKLNHSSPPRVEVKNEWSYTCIPPICLHGEDSDCYTSTFYHVHEIQITCYARIYTLHSHQNKLEMMQKMSYQKVTRDWEKPQKKTLTIAGTRVEIQTQHLRNTNFRLSSLPW